jgi:catechol 2,3-dioxygenase-like lactoylglutathione lyase family enzyme
VNGPALPADFKWAAMVPELVVSDLGESLGFWRDLLGFEMAYKRPEAGFAYLYLAEAQIMLAERRGMARWLPAEMSKPFGRGLNLQVTVDDLKPPLARLRKYAWPLYLDVEEAWYRAGHIETGVRQFAVADPDGYLVRLSSPLGQRPFEPKAVEE